MPAMQDLTLSLELTRDIQGNILYGYRRVRSVLLFVRFGSDVAANQAWVRNFALNPAGICVSSAVKPDGEMDLVNFLISSKGLTKLGGDASLADRAFKRGSHDDETLRQLTDAKKGWQPEFTEPWDAVLLVACTAARFQQVEAALEAAGAACVQHHLERGYAVDQAGIPLDDAQADAPFYEAFGYRDGISRSYFTDVDPKTGAVSDRWSARRPLSIALTTDPLNPEGWASYFVFRKLKQNVPGFKAHVDDVVKELLSRKGDGTVGQFLFALYGSNPRGAFGIFSGSPTPEQVREFVKARIMGRYPNGAPVASPQATSAPADNDFDYAGDRAGLVCPFHAHVRAMNPRGQREGADAEKKRDILRRSWVYLNGADVSSASEAGLLFLCAQSDIENQFEFHQKHANGAASLELEPMHGPDYLVSQPRIPADELEYGDGLNRLKRYGTTIDIDVRASQFVQVRGSEYLLAPSLSGLRRLVGGAS